MPQGRLIAHPDISLVLRNTDMSKLRAGAGGAGRAAARSPRRSQDAHRHPGREVLTAYAPIVPLGWTMFVELPIEEAYALALRGAAAARRSCCSAASIFAVLAGLFLARRMVVTDPGAARRRGAHRQRRPRPAHLDPDRRRAGRARQPVQRHGRAAAGILCRPGEQGRAAHRGIERNRWSSRLRHRRYCR